jgi:hypothetical protein
LKFFSDDDTLIIEDGVMKVSRSEIKNTNNPDVCFSLSNMIKAVTIFDEMNLKKDPIHLKSSDDELDVVGVMAKMHYED